MFRWWRNWRQWDAASAKARILRGAGYAGMRVRGSLDLSRQSGFCLPDDLQAEAIQLADCADLRQLPARLSCARLQLQRSAVEALPDGLNVTEQIDAQDCRRLARVGAITTRELNLRGCVRLDSLANGLNASSLDLTGCYRLKNLPAFGGAIRNLCVRDCAGLTELPEGMMRLETLDLRGCQRLESIPDDIRVRLWVDVAGSGLTRLPWSLRSVRVCWNRVPVPDRIAFEPESITVKEIMEERNVEIRRVLLERVGTEWFVDHAQAIVVDEDQDAGGARRLLQIPFDGDEDYFFVEVRCPTTAGRYLLRVPPRTRTCHQAVAWTAGFRSVESYRPVVET